MENIEQFYRKERNNLIKRVKNRAGSIENAEDVVQEAFCKAIQYYAAYNPRGEFGGWFNSILENTLKDYKRDERLGGMTTVNIEEVEEDVHDEITDHYLPNLKSLKPEHKKIVNMYFKLGYTKNEISHASGMKLKAIDKFIQRFTSKIRVGND